MGIASVENGVVRIENEGEFVVLRECLERLSGDDGTRDLTLVEVQHKNGFGDGLNPSVNRGMRIYYCFDGPRGAFNFESDNWFSLAFLCSDVMRVVVPSSAALRENRNDLWNGLSGYLASTGAVVDLMADPDRINFEGERAPFSNGEEEHFDLRVRAWGQAKVNHEDWADQKPVYSARDEGKVKKVSERFLPKAVARVKVAD